jgi:hypothetical protein
MTIFAGTALGVVIACGERRKLEDRTTVIEFDSTPMHYASGVSAPMGVAMGIEDVVKTDLSTIPDVHGVSVELYGDEYIVNVAVRQPEKAARYRIYAKQASLIEAYPNYLFDFRLVEAI